MDPINIITLFVVAGGGGVCVSVSSSLYKSAEQDYTGKDKIHY